MSDGVGRATVERVVDERFDGLWELSCDIAAHPELCFEERYSSKRVADELERDGFVLERGVATLETAFAATFGSGELVISILAEYDALPDIGHACGHNLIAACAIGGGLTLATFAERLGITVKVIGTPAEEGGGGKVLMLDRGIFDGVHAALMIHPWPSDWLSPRCLAVTHFDVTFHGITAHASANPQSGKNALDAMTIAQVAIGLLRQQLDPGDQVHGVVLDGGTAANVIPEMTRGRYMVRTPTMQRLGPLVARVKACFEAGALASGTTLDYDVLAPDYSHLESDPDLLALYRTSAQSLGRRFEGDDANLPAPTISTDVANVSLAIPTIQPLLGIASDGATNHQAGFARACVGDDARRALRDGSIILSEVGAGAALDTRIRSRLLERR